MNWKDELGCAQMELSRAVLRINARERDGHDPDEQIIDHLRRSGSHLAAAISGISETFDIKSKKDGLTA